ncbi:MAG: FAD-dependent oxidoreductase [Firmicutes bacterium]|nr:FAD-dependent oxidoreductase [Bacillota bacterium]
MKYEKLFTSGKIGRLELKNRIVMPAMATALANSTGEISDRLLRYFEERARGGCGLIITGIARVDNDNGAGIYNQIGAYSPKFIPQLQRLADIVHRYDTRIFVQLHHPGREGSVLLNDGRQTVAPSVIANSRTNELPKELTTEEIERLVKKFVMGAVICKNAGIDGIELHGAHGYLINAFISPLTNKRTDKYGGSFEGRMRFISEIIYGIRQNCGLDFPISVRLSVDEFVDGGIKLEDGIEVAKYLESLGVDAINVSNGIRESGVTIVEPYTYAPGWKKHLAAGVKANVKIPIIAVNLIRQPDLAERLLEEGVCDFVALGRAQLADPEWANKAAAGREAEIRPCISCRTCIEAVSNGKHIICAVNPRLGRELEFGEFIQNGDGRLVAVIGGGPGGMEAARVLAIRGFKVILFEKEDRLGGALNLANKPLYKDKINWLIDYYQQQMKHPNIEVRLNTEANVELIKTLNPYGVFVAVGASPIVPPIPGVDGENVCLAEDVLKGKIKISGKNVAVIGAGMTGCETAEFLAAQGNKVTLVDMLEKIGAGISYVTLLMLMSRLKKYNPTLLPGHKLIRIYQDRIILENVKNRQETELPVERVVLALGVSPRKDLVDSFKRSLANVKVVGDANRAGNIIDAVHDGFGKAFVFVPITQSK